MMMMAKQLTKTQRELVKRYLLILLAQLKADKKAAAKGRVN